MVRKDKVGWKKLKYMCNYNNSKLTKMIPAIAGKIYFIQTLTRWLGLTAL